MRVVRAVRIVVDGGDEDGEDGGVDAVCRSFNFQRASPTFIYLFKLH